MNRHVRELRAYWRDTVSSRDLLRLLRVRLSQTRLGPLVCRGPFVAHVSLRSMGGPVWLRSHTSDVSVLNELIVWDLYGPIRRHAREPVQMIVDLGANTGLSARWLLTLYPSARIVCVEPDPENVAMLHQNLSALRARATIIPACIGATQRRAGLVTTNGSWAVEMTDGDQVDVTTMDTLELDRIDVLKCNIEGAEREVFADPGEWLNTVRLACVEWHHGDDSDLVGLKDWHVVEQGPGHFVTLR